MSENLTREQRFAAWVEKKEKAEAEVYAVVKPVIDKFDPESLMKLGCPSDEYEPEAKLIAEAIIREGLNRISVEELGHLIAFAWHYEFGQWGSPVNYHNVFFEMAKEIQPQLPEYRLFRGL